MRFAWVGLRLVRGQARGCAAIALLLGISCGVGMWAVAGSRRTESAYLRFLRSTNASTMAIDAGPYNPRALAGLAHLPGVTSARSYAAANVAVLENGHPDLGNSPEAVGSIDGRYFDQDRFTPTHGRRPNPNAVDEVALNENAAMQLGYHVGSMLDLGVYSTEQMRSPSFYEHPPPPKLQLHAKVVGVGLFVEEVEQDEFDLHPLMLLTPAFTDRAIAYHDATTRRGDLTSYTWTGVVLRRSDAGIEAAKDAYVVAAGGAPATSPRYFRITSNDTFHAVQAVRPTGVALALLGVIAIVAGLVLVGQALGRLLRRQRAERRILRAVGMSPRAAVAGAMVGPVFTIVVGVVFAGLLAVAMSPLMPVGRVRKVEVAPGLNVDWTVLAIGMFGIGTVLVGTAAVQAFREAPPRNRALMATRSHGPLSALVSRLPAPATTAVHLAFGRDSPDTLTAMRSLVAGTATAVVAVIATVVFGTSLIALVRQPRSYGWDWQITLSDRGGYGQIHTDRAAALLNHDPKVAAWSSAYFGSDSLDGQNLPLLGITPGTRVLPPLVSGRQIVSGSEVVLGPATLSSLHKHLGDTVTIGSIHDARPLRIVGIAIFPTIGIGHGAHTSLGVGAMVDHTLVPGSQLNILHARYSGPNALFVRLRHANDAAAEIRLLGRVTSRVGSQPGSLSITSALRPAEIVNTSELRRAPALGVALLAIVTTISIGLGLGTSVRQRSREFATLKSIGFTRRQITSTIAWQSTITTALGLTIGIPAGLLCGRILWRLFSQQLDVVPALNVPIAAIAVVAVAALATANLLAAISARTAQRTRPSVITAARNHD